MAAVRQGSGTITNMTPRLWVVLAAFIGACALDIYLLVLTLRYLLHGWFFAALVLAIGFGIVLNVLLWMMDDNR